MSRLQVVEPVDEGPQEAAASAAEIRISDVTIVGQRIRVGVIPGDGSHRCPLLLCNGFGVNLELLAPISEALTGIETIAFDVPGIGGSSAPRVPYRFEGLAWLVSRLLDRLGYEQVDVLGVSWGGVLAQQLAFQYPRRVRRLILAATAPGAVCVPGRIKAMLKVMNPRRHRDPSHILKIAATSYGGVFREAPELAAEYFRLARPPSLRGYLGQGLAGMGHTSIHWLHWVRQPTLVMSGSDDPLVPAANARLLTHRMPNARLHIVQDGGHLFLLTNAREVAPVIRDFLAT